MSHWLSVSVQVAVLGRRATMKHCFSMLLWQDGSDISLGGTYVTK